MQKAIAETSIALDAPSRLLYHYIKHMREDHDLFFDISDAGVYSFEQSGYRIELELKDRALRVLLEAPTARDMAFSKEGMVHHIAEFDPAAAQNVRWENEQAGVGAAPANFRLLTVRKSAELFDGMQRVTLHYPDIDRLQDHGIHFRLILPCNRSLPPVWPVMGPNGAPVWPEGADDKLHARYITLKNIRTDVQEVDIDIVHHDAGPVSQWACNATAGDIVGAMGPTGMHSLPDARTYFIAADGTGLPAVAQFLSRLPADAGGDVVVALPQTVNPWGYFPKSKLKMHVLSPHEFEARILEFARDLTKQGTTDYGFFAGEFANAQSVRGHFKKALKLDKTSQISTAYWRR
tara:strand:- start:418 stop:1464 length:1047 start_codon:yes stop_codon:yes gene_type:complete